MVFKRLFPLFVAASLGSVPVISYSSESVSAESPKQEMPEFTAEQVDKQLNFLMAKSYEAGQEEIKSAGSMRPYAVGLLPNGKVKTLYLNKEQPMPVDVAVRVLNSAMTSWMEQELAVATVVYYTAESAGTERLLLIELKHVNGHKLTRVVPYVIGAAGVVGFGKVIESEVTEQPD